MAKAILLFVGTGDGALLFSNPNNIGRWLRIGQPFRGHAVLSLWPLPDNPLVVFAAVAGMGLQRSDDGGQSWRAALELEMRTVAGQHSTTDVLYADAVNGELYVSQDAGDHWQPTASGARSAGSGHLIVAPEDARKLYLGMDDGVWFSADGAQTWARYGIDLAGPIQGLATVPGQPGMLYAVATSELYACAGANEPWEPRAEAGLADGALTVLAGNNAALLLARSDGGLQRSDDDGAIWTAVGAEIDWGGSITVITPASYHMDTAFAGTSGGRLAMTTDRGRTWQLLKQDLPPIQSIAVARLA